LFVCHYIVMNIVSFPYRNLRTRYDALHGVDDFSVVGFYSDGPGYYTRTFSVHVGPDEEYWAYDVTLLVVSAGSMNPDLLCQLDVSGDVI
jgi:hypothetical protein